MRHEAFIIEPDHRSSTTSASDAGSDPHLFLPTSFVFFVSSSSLSLPGVGEGGAADQRRVRSGLTRGRSARVINWPTTTNGRDGSRTVAPAGNLDTTRAQTHWLCH